MVDMHLCHTAYSGSRYTHAQIIKHRPHAELSILDSMSWSKHATRYSQKRTRIKYMHIMVCYKAIQTSNQPSYMEYMLAHQQMKCHA
jgi:hypothetical protein